jgi:hypothetical protein
MCNFELSWEFYFRSHVYDMVHMWSRVFCYMIVLTGTSVWYWLMEGMCASFLVSLASLTKTWKHTRCSGMSSISCLINKTWSQNRCSEGLDLLSQILVSTWKLKTIFSCDSIQHIVNKAFVIILKQCITLNDWCYIHDAMVCFFFS